MQNRSIYTATALASLISISPASTPLAAQAPAPASPAPASEQQQDPQQESQPADTNLLKDRPVTIQYLRPVDRRGDSLYAGARHNRVTGRLAGMTSDVEADRWQFGGGWFITSSLLLKAEYVNQEFKGYPAVHIRNGGKFKGMMLEGVVAF